MNRDILLEFGQWLANEPARLSTVLESLGSDQPDEYVEAVDAFLRQYAEPSPRR